MSSVFRQNQPTESMFLDFNWEEPNKTWIYAQGTIITVVASVIILYVMCVVWNRSLVRVER